MPQPSEKKHGTRLHAALTEASMTSPSKRMSVVAHNRQSVAKARGDLLSGAAASGTRPPFESASSVHSTSSKQLFSRDLQPLINSRFSLDSSSQVVSSQDTVCSTACGALVACDRAASSMCGSQERRKHLRESLVLHKGFDTFILVVIAANAICLAADSPLLDENSRSATALRIFDVIFTIIFVIEAVLKISALVSREHGQVSTHS